jgi:sugar phosphate isomerase/epimerase
VNLTRRSLLSASALAVPSLTPAAVETVSGKGRLRTAICAYSYRKLLESKAMTYEDLVRMSSDWGVEGLDLTVYWFPSTEDSFLLPLKRLAYRAGVEIYSISVRTNMCQPTEELQRKEIAEVKKWVDVAAKLGAGHIRVFGGNVPKGSSEDDAAGWVVKVLGEAGQYAGSRGVILGLENHGGITEKASRMVEIVKKVDSPWVAVNLDTGNFRTKVYEQISMLVPYAAAVQVKAEVVEDGKRGPSDWDRVAGMLVKQGYKGYLSVEYEAAEDVKTAMPKMLERLRGVIGRSAA